MVIEFKGKPMTEEQLMSALSMLSQNNIDFLPPQEKSAEAKERQAQADYEKSRRAKAESFEGFENFNVKGYQNKVYISADKRVFGLDKLKASEINMPNATGMTPFQVALAVRDMDALAKIVQMPDFKLCQSSDTSYRSQVIIGERPVSSIATNLTNFMHLTERFHSPKPMDEIEDTILMKFVQSIDALGTPEHNEKACEEVLDIFRSNLAGCALADAEARVRGDSGLTVSVFDPMTQSMVDSDVMELIDELYFRPGFQVPKENRWILRAIHMTNVEMDMPDDLRSNEDRALANLAKMAESAEFISQEYALKQFAKIHPDDIKSALGLMATIGQKAWQQEKEIKAIAKEDSANKRSYNRVGQSVDIAEVKKSIKSTTIGAGPFAGLGDFVMQRPASESDSQDEKKSTRRTDYAGVKLSDYAKRAIDKESKSGKKTAGVSEKWLLDQLNQLEEENDYNI